MIKVTVFNAWTGEYLWSKFFHCEEKAESYANFWWTEDQHSTYEKV